MSGDPHDPKPGVGRPYGGGIIVNTTGPKWGIVEMPDGRRVVRDVSVAIAGAVAEQAAGPPTKRRLLGIATHADLADEAGIEAFVQMILERTMDVDIAEHGSPPL